MKVTVVRGGGLAGIVTETEVDSDQLSPDDADALEAKVREAGLFDLNDEATPPSYADEVSYRLSIEDDERSHTVTLREGTLTDTVRSLISWLDAVAGNQKRISPPGPPAS
jgi:hypothetical protein